MKYIKYSVLIFILTALSIMAQENIERTGDVYVDSNGRMRWKVSNEEVKLFGVNYTVPFAFSYRAHKKLDLSIKKAIDIDVSHFKRLGFDAFRVHVWDREISDKDGNLKQNEHLELLDYLIDKLSKNGIKTIITPIAWWNPGYPEPDFATEGFSNFYSKVELCTNKTAIEAQKNYLKQFLLHKNKFTGNTYKEEPSIIALEIINEPKHPKEDSLSTVYVNELSRCIRALNYIKPVFYNISENWSFEQANAVTKAEVDGISFQWYPTALVHGTMLKGNYLINVNKYLIPKKGIEGYDKKAKMVYEFDAADVGGSYMYPAIARSFREAGIQFATMFSYDPVQIAWGNTEYPTHFMNLLYTPSKAISLMIAARAFRCVPIYTNYGDFPANNSFGPFRVSYEENLSEMNSDKEFYYSNSTNSKPVSGNTLQHIAGCGNSELVKYEGTGVYFLDRLEEGVWRLEVYPDAVWTNDPFGSNSLKRSVARLYWKEHIMSFSFAGLDTESYLIPFSKKEKKESSVDNSFKVKPGLYLLCNGRKNSKEIEKYIEPGDDFLKGIYQPEEEKPGIIVHNTSQLCVAEGKDMRFGFSILSNSDITNVKLYVRRLGWRGFEKHEMKKNNRNEFSYTGRWGCLKVGKTEYCISVTCDNKTYTFPGGKESSPDDYDFRNDKYWDLFVCKTSDPIVIYDPVRDKDKLILPNYNPFMKYNIDYTEGSMINSNALGLQIDYKEKPDRPFGMQLSAEEIISARKDELNEFNSVVVKGKALQKEGCKLELVFIMKDGVCKGTKINLPENWKEISVHLSEFINTEALILPDSYPLFLQKFWKGKETDEKINIADISTMQIICPVSENEKSGVGSHPGFLLEEIFLTK